MEKLTPTSYAILGLLSIEPNQSGYDIRKMVKGTVSYFWGESYGQIYPALKRLAAAGLIVGSNAGRKGSAGRPERQQYSATEAGLERLRDWLAIPYSETPPRDEFLLKLFFGGEAPAVVSIAQIKAFQEKNRRMLAMLQQIAVLSRERNGDHPHFPFWMLTVTFGISQLQAALEWSDSAMAILQGPAPTAGPVEASTTMQQS